MAFEQWKHFLAKHLAPAEESRLYRAAVCVLVMFALVLTLHQIEWPSYWWMVILLTPLASYLSYQRRHQKNLEIKIFLSFAMVALLFWFLTRLRASTYDPRIPLAELLIWLQTLHCFDLPAKKDLRYTVLVALILMALASVLTFSSLFGVFVLIFCALFLLTGVLDFWSENRRPGTREHRFGAGVSAAPTSGFLLDRAWVATTLVYAIPACLLAAAVIFLFMPRYRGLTLRSMPVSWDLQFSLTHISTGEIHNPSLGDAARDRSGKPRRVDGDSYFGFDSEVDLNTRGKLSDRLVLKVRTSDWQYHRAVTFAEYTGTGWRSGLAEPASMTVRQPPYYFHTPRSSKDRLTIYYSEVELPNVVFTPQYPRRLFFPSDELYRVDSFSAEQDSPNARDRRARLERPELINSPAVLVAPFNLETGVVYSVLNKVPEVAPSDYKNLRALSPDDPRWRSFGPYLQLPEDLPERVRSKAAEIVGARSGPWEQATALATYLQHNYTYDLDVDFYPEGVDTADHFLFESQVGYCEQFATALCVMARSLNLPARYVTGYLPGEYNPFTGFYEIRARDAHAWVEIFIPGAGWIIFDPVPGENATPSLGEAEPERWLFESLLEYLGLPEPVKRFAPVVVRLFVLLALAALAWGLLGRGASRQDLRLKRSPLEPYLRRAEALTAPRAPGETVRNWARRLGRAELSDLADVYEATLYRGRAVEAADYQTLEELLRGLKTAAAESLRKEI